ncbi:MAG: hypothetical protein AAGK02_06680 [Pseudomonadota bacterium]
MEHLLTIKEAVKAFEIAEARRDAGDKMLQQLRGAVGRGLLRHEDSAGPKGALRFSVSEIIIARILLAVVNLGLKGDELASLNSSLRNEEADRAISDVLSLFEDLNRKTNADAPRINFEFFRYLKIGDEPIRSTAYFVFDGEYGEEIDPKIPNVRFRGGTIEAVVTIPFSKLAMDTVRGILTVKQ